MRKNSTKRTLLTSVMALLLCFAMLIGTTYAWFTDTVESGSNIIKTGNLDVEFEYWKNATDGYVDVQGATDIFDPNALWEPGHAEVAYLKVSNAGSLAIKYIMSLNILGNTIGKTKGGQEIDLAKYLNFAIIPGAVADAYATRQAAIDAASVVPHGVHTFSEVLDSDADSHGWLNDTGYIIKAAEGQEEQIDTYAIVVWMPDTVGNEANHDGVNVPSINLGLTVFATQYAAENDSFGPDFDSGAYWPYKASAAVNVPSNTADRASAYDLEARNVDGSKGGSANVPKDAIKEGVNELKFVVEKTELNPNIIVTSGNDAVTFDVDVIGLKENNDTPVKVNLFVGTNLTGVQLYHHETLLTEENSNFLYNPTTGYASFEVTHFSPFTLLYSVEEEYEAPKVEVEDDKVYVWVGGPGEEVKVEVAVPTANVVYKSEFVNTDLAWGSYGTWSPTASVDPDPQLEAAFEFSCPTLTSGQLAVFDRWYCDFYVSLDRNLGENQIFLGGNYGSFGWIGFHNGDITLDAGTEVGLLEGVTTNPWTYADVRSFVGTFTCGVSDVNNVLEGATFTVKLRLTNPDNSAEYFNVNVVTYTFGEGYNIQ